MCKTNSNAIQKNACMAKVLVRFYYTYMQQIRVSKHELLLLLRFYYNYMLEIRTLSPILPFKNGNFSQLLLLQLYLHCGYT